MRLCCETIVKPICRDFSQQQDWPRTVPARTALAILCTECRDQMINKLSNVGRIPFVRSLIMKHLANCSRFREGRDKSRW